MNLRFNVRVYGIVINSNKEVLLSHEKYQNFEFTKFPGGGLEYGEGTLEGLRREFLEELGIEPFNFRHLYTTDFFQKSVMNDTQIISIYYLVDIDEYDIFPIATDTGKAYFHKINNRLLEVVELPIDKVVVKMLLEKFNQ